MRAEWWGVAWAGGGNKESACMKGGGRERRCGHESAPHQTWPRQPGRLRLPALCSHWRALRPLHLALQRPTSRPRPASSPPPGVRLQRRSSASPPSTPRQPSQPTWATSSRRAWPPRVSDRRGGRAAIWRQRGASPPTGLHRVHGFLPPAGCGLRADDSVLPPQACRRVLRFLTRAKWTLARWEAMAGARPQPCLRVNFAATALLCAPPPSAPHPPTHPPTPTIHPPTHPPTSSLIPHAPQKAGGQPGLQRDMQAQPVSDKLPTQHGRGGLTGARPQALLAGPGAH